MRRVLRAAMHGRPRADRGGVRGLARPGAGPDAFPPASRDDARCSSGLPKVKVAATWVPWTSAGSPSRSGYGAGVDRARLVPAPLRPTPGRRTPSSPLAGPGRPRCCASEDLDARTASVVEAVRLADALAAVRGRPSAGPRRARRTPPRPCCATASTLPLQLVAPRLVVGEAWAPCPTTTPMVPLAADLAAQQRRCGCKPRRPRRRRDLDLRKPSAAGPVGPAAPAALLGVDWGAPADAGRTTGTFKEAWALAVAAGARGRPDRGQPATAPPSRRRPTRWSPSGAGERRPRRARRCSSRRACSPTCPTASARVVDAAGRAHGAVSTTSSQLLDDHRAAGPHLPLRQRARSRHRAVVARCSTTVVVRASRRPAAGVRPLDDDAAARDARGASTPPSAASACVDGPNLRGRGTRRSLGVADRRRRPRPVAGRVTRLLLDARRRRPTTTWRAGCAGASRVGSRRPPRRGLARGLPRRRRDAAAP